MSKDKIQDCLNEYYKVLSVKTLEVQLEMLKNIIKNEFGFDFPVTNTTDREKLEIIQEMYSLIYCFVKGLDYKTFDIRGHLNDKYFDWIAEYKYENFSKEILKEFGMELIEKNEKGLVVRDTIPTTKIC